MDVEFLGKSRSRLLRMLQKIFIVWQHLEAKTSTLIEPTFSKIRPFELDSVGELGLSYEPPGIRSAKVDTLSSWRGRGALPLLRTTEDMKMVRCAGCERPILDRFLLNVLDRSWHAKCVQCCECKCNLTEKCFSREGKLYCRNDFFK